MTATRSTGTVTAALAALLLWASAAAAQTGGAAAADSLAGPATAAPEPAAAAADDTRAVPAAQAAGVARAEAEVDLWDTGISPTGAVLMTPLFPGWGQLYADNSWRAALAYGAQMYFWTNMLSRERQAVRYGAFSETFAPDDPNRRYYAAVADENWEQMRDFAWWSGGALLIIALDAYVGAHLFNFDQDPVPVPNRWDDAFGPLAHGPAADDGPTVVVFQWRKTF
jgi:hypothetical protein